MRKKVRTARFIRPTKKAPTIGAGMLNPESSVTRSERKAPIVSITHAARSDVSPESATVEGTR